MRAPPTWTREQLTAEAAVARDLFRRQRLQEPLEKWKETFDRYQAAFVKLFDQWGIANPARLTHEQITAIFREKLGDAFRYLAGPPISADDLKVLAETTLAPGRLAASPGATRRILDTLLLALDSRRFPWVAAGRPPTEAEKAAAVLSSAVLITSQRVSTDRRNEGKAEQEKAVKMFLVKMGFVEIAARTIRTLDDAPRAGQFCGESLVGSRKADIPIRLFDGRLMPVECKVSNSSTNSVKRINNDAAVKAAIWHREFGVRQVVPAAMLSGVFKVLNLEQAQEGDLTLFWAHRMNDMREFIMSTKVSPETR